MAPNPRFKEIHQALAEIVTFTSHKSVWGRVDYIKKHLNLLEDEYYQSSCQSPNKVNEK